MKRMAVLLAALLMLLTAVASADPAILTVNGTGVVTMDPDTAVLSLGVQESAIDVSEAQAEVNKKVAAVVEKLTSMGVKADDIHTGSIYIYKDYDYSSSFVRTQDERYVARYDIYFDTKDIDNAGKYIDAVFDAGANNFNNISFSASDTEKEKTRALELAVENAKVKADVLAAAAGMKVAGIEAIREMSYGTIGNYSAMNDMFAKAESVEAGAGTTVMADKIQVSASVAVDFIMEPIQ